MKTRRILAAAACLIVIGAAVFFLTRRTRAERVTEFLASAGRFEEQNDYESAIITLRNALRLAPGNARIHAGLAQDYAMINETLSSLKHYNAALRLGRHDVQFLTDYAEACVRFNAISELAEPAAKLLEARPDDPDAHFWMARSLAANPAGRSCSVLSGVVSSSVCVMEPLRFTSTPPSTPEKKAASGLIAAKTQPKSA